MIFKHEVHKGHEGSKPLRPKPFVSLVSFVVKNFLKEIS
jgi:hypothetical protein